MQPRYHLEMALLRWIHLRRLVPLTELIQNLEKGGSPATARSAAAVASRAPGPPPPAVKTVSPERRVSSPVPRTAGASAEASTPGAAAAKASASGEASAPKPAEPVPPSALKDAFLAEVQKTKKFFYGTVVLQAHSVELNDDRLVFTFGSAAKDRALKQQLEQTRPWLEELATRLSGRRMSVVAVEGTASAPPRSDEPRPEAAPEAEVDADRQAALKQQALSNSGVQAMLDVFAAEIKEVEER
jgi:hypothetical protein